MRKIGGQLMHNKETMERMVSTWSIRQLYNLDPSNMILVLLSERVSYNDKTTTDSNKIMFLGQLVERPSVILSI
jgi:hypothetical protein